MFVERRATCIDYLFLISPSHLSSFSTPGDPNKLRCDSKGFEMIQKQKFLASKCQCCRNMWVIEQYTSKSSPLVHLLELFEELKDGQQKSSRGRYLENWAQCPESWGDQHVQQLCVCAWPIRSLHWFPDTAWGLNELDRRPRILVFDCTTQLISSAAWLR